MVAISPSMYSLGWMEGLRAFLAPKKFCRFDIMMSCGSESRSERLLPPEHVPTMEAMRVLLADAVPAPEPGSESAELAPGATTIGCGSHASASVAAVAAPELHGALSDLERLPAAREARLTSLTEGQESGVSRLCERASPCARNSWTLGDLRSFGFGLLRPEDDGVGALSNESPLEPRERIEPADLCFLSARESLVRSEVEDAGGATAATVLGPPPPPPPAEDGIVAVVTVIGA